MQEAEGCMKRLEKFVLIACEGTLLGSWTLCNICPCPLYSCWKPGSKKCRDSVLSSLSSYQCGSVMQSPCCPSVSAWFPLNLFLAHSFSFCLYVGQDNTSLPLLSPNCLLHLLSYIWTFRGDFSGASFIPLYASILNPDYFHSTLPGEWWEIPMSIDFYIWLWKNYRSFISISS